MKKNYKLRKNLKLGYWRLHPLPKKEDLDKFYKDKYYRSITKGERVPEIKKFMQGGKISNQEIHWLQNTLFQEIEMTLNNSIRKKNKYLLDVGCGQGDFIHYMQRFGWNTVGVEPSVQATKTKLAKKMHIYNMTFDMFLGQYTKKYVRKFDAITLLNVLEHVPNPSSILQWVKVFLKEKVGILCIKVPNDFNILQKYAQKRTKKKKWWIAVPDHVHYFNIESIQKFLKKNGFQVLDVTADFPMELFLLMGLDYTKDRKIGSLCHQRRVNFELSLPYEFRRKFYRTLASLGLGRECIIYTKINKK